MAIVEMLTSEQIVDRRKQLLKGAGLSEDELRARAEQYALTPEQVALLEELDDLDYLLSA